MSAKVYILLNIPDGKSAQIVKTLREQTGVVMADMLEGPPDIAVVVEAPDRQKLADAGVQAIAPVGNMIEDIRLLPTIIGSYTGTSERKRASKKQSDP